MGSTLSAKPIKTNRTTATDRRGKFEAEMRAKGYKRVVRWLPDTSNPDFIAQYRREIEAIAKHHQKFGLADFLPPEEDVPWLELKRGDIVTIAPPGDFSKPRPALVLQAYLPEALETVTLVPITSDLLRQPAIRVPIKPTTQNGLKKSSEIMADNVQTLLRKRVGTVIGSVDDQTMRRVEAAVAVFLGIGISSK